MLGTKERNKQASKQGKRKKKKKIPPKLSFGKNGISALGLATLPELPRPRLNLIGGIDIPRPAIGGIRGDEVLRLIPPLMVIFDGVVDW
jgi:hypothetical protein